MVIEPGAFRTDFSGRSLTESSHRIDDYADTLGSRRKENDKTHGHEPGDPARAAKAIINLVEGSENPFRLLLGSDAVAIITAELENQISEVNAWETVSVTTDLPGVTWNDLSYAQISRQRDSRQVRLASSCRTASSSASRRPRMPWSAAMKW